MPLLRDVQQNRVGELDGDAAKRGRLHARVQLEQKVIRSAAELYRATARRKGAKPKRDKVDRYLAGSGVVYDEIMAMRREVASRY